MSYLRGLAEIVPPMVSSMTMGWSMVAQERIGTTEASSGGFGSADRAVYFPILVPTTCIAKRLWWANGTTVSASYNVDVGIYLDAGYKPGTKLVSTGSTAQGTASQVQFVDITDTTLKPGLHWLAIACSTTSATIFRFGPTAGIAALLRFQQDSGMPLPATATPVESTPGNVYLFGFATTASP